jgi:hypothetical protein
VDAILQLAAAHYDFVLIDMGRVLDPLALRVLDRAQLIVPVLLPNVPAVRNAQKLLHMFRDLGYPESRLHPVLNRVDRRSEIGLPEVRKALGLEQQWRSIPTPRRKCRQPSMRECRWPSPAATAPWSANWAPGPMRCRLRPGKTATAFEPALPPGMSHP